MESGFPGIEKALKDGLLLKVAKSSDRSKIARLVDYNLLPRNTVERPHLKDALAALGAEYLTGKVEEIEHNARQLKDDDDFLDAWVSMGNTLYSLRNGKIPSNPFTFIAGNHLEMEILESYGVTFTSAYDTMLEGMKPEYFLLASMGRIILPVGNGYKKYS